MGWKIATAHSPAASLRQKNEPGKPQVFQHTSFEHQSRQTLMANFLTQNWLLNRRHVLKGAGVALALPFLECMRPLRAAEAAPSVKRSVFMYLPNGVNPADYQILDSGKDYTFSHSLKSLERHRANITPISGLHHPFGLGRAHECSNIWLTGARFDASHRNTISVDQLMSRVTEVQTRFSSLQLSSERRRSLSWTADGVALPEESVPSVVFRQLFEEPKEGVDVQRRQLQRRGSILDTVLGEARRLDSRLGNQDSDRLEQYLTSVREIEIRTQRADSWLDRPRPKVDKKTSAQLDRDIPLDQLGEYLRTMYDLIVLAFQTDSTRVVTFMTGDEGTGPAIPEIGINFGRHALSHHNGNRDMLANLTASDTFNIEQFSYFLDRLSEVSDAAGPLIDTTMALYGGGMAYGHSHGNANLPLVMAGGKSLGIKHGRHLDYNALASPDGYNYNAQQPGSLVRICHKPVNPKAHLSNLLLTMAQKMDVPIEKFSDSNSEATELLA